MLRYLYVALCLGFCMLLLIGCGKKNSAIPGQDFTGPGLRPGEPPPAGWKSNAPQPGAPAPTTETPSTK